MILQEAHIGIKEKRDLATHISYNNLYVLLKLFILLYTDDTVLLAESLDVVDHHKYLGLIFFNFNGKLTVAKKELYEKGNTAMFSLMRKSR